ALYDNGMFCCETVLTVANEAAGNRLPAEVMSLGSGFWGGMAGDGSTCGALVGAVMACGLLAGRTHTAGAWEPSTDAAEEIRRAFRTEHGSVSCNCLIRPFGGMDGEGRHAHCARLTGATSAMVVRIAEERGWL
ncbi:MAG: C-GCAxxG-C-C family protein, partial [Coriobacteriia bacterium]|nr:C-GCAxxG-C-C family protein [Coriobacteriia bacterium]